MTYTYTFNTSFRQVYSEAVVVNSDGISLGRRSVFQSITMPVLDSTNPAQYLSTSFNSPITGSYLVGFHTWVEISRKRSPSSQPSSSHLILWAENEAIAQ